MRETRLQQRSATRAKTKNEQNRAEKKTAPTPAHPPVGIEERSKSKEKQRVKGKEKRNSRREKKRMTGVEIY